MGVDAAKVVITQSGTGKRRRQVGRRHNQNGKLFTVSQLDGGSKSGHQRVILAAISQWRPDKAQRKKPGIGKCILAG